MSTDGVSGYGATVAAASRASTAAPILANASGRQLARNFAAGYVNLAIGILLSLFLTPVILNVLGASNYGLWIGVTAIGSYIGILDAGVSTAAVQLIALATALGDRDRLADIYFAIRWFFVLTGVLAVLVAAALAPLAATIFNLEPGTNMVAEISLIMVGIITGMGFLRTVPAALFNGSGRSDKNSLIGSVASLVGQSLQIGSVLLGAGVIGLFAVSAVAATVQLMVSNRIARLSGLTFPKTGHQVNWAVLRELLRSGSRNAVIGISGMVAFTLDAVVIGAILPISQIAPYDIGLSTANLARNLSTAGTNLLLPTYAHAFALDNKERQFRLYSRAVLLSMAISIPVIVSLLVVGPGLLVLWLGSVPRGTYEVLVALNVVVLLQLPGYQSFLFLTGIGRNRLLMRIAAPVSVLNLALSVAATFWVGPLGPALGSLPQVIFVDFMLLPMLCCKYVDQPFGRYLKESLLPLWPSLCISAGCALGLAWAVGRDSGWATILIAVVATLSGWAASVATMWRSEPAVRSAVRRVVLGYWRARGAEHNDGTHVD